MRKQRTILFITYGGGHVNMVLPVVKKFKRTSGFKIVVFGLTTAANVFRKNGIFSRGFSSLLRAGDESALKLGEKLLADLTHEAGIDRQESVAYLGLSYKDLEDRLGKETAQAQYRKNGRQAFLPLNPIRRMFDDVRPDLVVATISPRAEQAALMVARERGIPSVCLVDFFPIVSIKRAALPHSGTKVCVLSEGVRSMLIKAGRSPEEVVVTGNPAFDPLAFTQFEIERREIRKKAGMV